MDIAIIALAIGLVVYFLGGPLEVAIEPKAAPGYGFFTAVIVAVVLYAVAGISYAATLGGVAEKEAFYRTTLDAYETTVEQTESIIIEVPGTVTATVEGTLIEIPVAQQGQAVAVSERLKELRNKVENFNAWLARNWTYNEVFFIRHFRAGAPADMKPISIEVV